MWMGWTGPSELAPGEEGRAEAAKQWNANRNGLPGSHLATGGHAPEGPLLQGKMPSKQNARWRLKTKGEGSGQGLASCAGTEFGQTTTKKAAGCMESNAHFLRDRDLLAGNTKGLR